MKSTFLLFHAAKLILLFHLTITLRVFFVILWKFSPSDVSAKLSRQLAFINDRVVEYVVRQDIIYGKMKKSLIRKATGPLILALLISACGAKTGNDKAGLPNDFASLSDAQKVEYMMNNVSPDSVARFICDAALGKLPEARIDTFALASAYAYEHYNDSDLLVFSREYDDYAANLPLADKMKILAMAGQIDPQGLGYELGLEYVSHIRDAKMTVDDVRKEIEAFKDACANDSSTYVRFMKGFQTVLKVDHGKDLPEEIYKKFVE